MTDLATETLVSLDLHLTGTAGVSLFISNLSPPPQKKKEMCYIVNYANIYGSLNINITVSE